MSFKFPGKNVFSKMKRALFLYSVNFKRINFSEGRIRSRVSFCNAEKARQEGYVAFGNFVQNYFTIFTAVRPVRGNN